MNIRALRAREPESAALRRYDEVARLLTGQPTAEADDGQAWIATLVRDLQIPPLGSYGLRREHVGEVVAKAVIASSMKANPIALTAEELAETLQAAL
jgi:alcohol dehydrogenase class IV